MAEFSSEDFISQLDIKVKAEIAEGHAYEGLQFVQSFIARKKKLMSADVVSQLVFRGATLLGESGSPSYAGNLLAWYLDGAAGEDKAFQVNNGNFSDVQRLTELLKKVDYANGEKILGPIYGNILPMLNKADESSKSIIQDMQKQWLDAFEAGGNWFGAFSAAVATEDIQRAAVVVDKWARDGFKSEGPLFFARAALFLFADFGRSVAIDFVKESGPYVSKLKGDATKINLACWHCAEMLADLAALNKQGPETMKAFIYISVKYRNILHNADPKLSGFLERAGVHHFGIKPKRMPVGMDPMTMLANMMGGMGPTPIARR